MAAGSHGRRRRRLGALLSLAAVAALGWGVAGGHGLALAAGLVLAVISQCLMADDDNPDLSR